MAKFRYDGEGRRILKMFDSQSPADPDGLDAYEHIFSSGQQVIETREGSGDTPAQAETLQPKYQQIWSPRYIDSLILRDENADTDGQCDDGRLFYLADANWNVTALIDPNGNVVERYVYSPYGHARIYTPDWSATRDNSLYSNTTLYTGRELDPSTGLGYYRARYYSGEMGRFVCRDPIRFWGSTWNLYEYVSSQPFRKVDPFGLRDGDVGILRPLPFPSIEPIDPTIPPPAVPLWPDMPSPGDLLRPITTNCGDFVRRVKTEPGYANSLGPSVRRVLECNINILWKLSWWIRIRFCRCLTAGAHLP